MSRRNLAAVGGGVAVLVGVFFAQPVRAASITWTKDATAVWSTDSNWGGGSGSVAAGDTADFSTLNITAARTVTIDTTSRTLGTFLIGDSGSTYYGYTIASSGGAVLTFDNNGGGAALTQTAASGSNTFTVPIVLNDALTITNYNASNGLAISGGITSTGGTRNLTLNSAAAGGIVLSSGTINNAGTIINAGTGAGVTTISSALGSSVTGITQNSASSALILSGSNTAFAGAISLTSGTLKIGSATALGGNGSATGAGGSLTISAGTTLDATAATTITTVNAQYWNGDFTFAGSNALNMGTGAVTLGGNRTVTVNANTFTIGGVIGDGGANYSLTKSGTGMLALSGSNTYGGGTTLNAGTLLLNNASALGTGPLTINGGALGLSNASSITLKATAQTWNGSFNYAGGATGTTLNTGTGAVTLGGNITLNNANGDGTQGFAVGGSIGDGGHGYKLTIASTGQGGITLSGSNTFSGGVTLNSGKFAIANGYALGSGTFTINGGTILASGQTLTANNAMAWNAGFAIGASTGSLNLGTGAVTLGANVGIYVSGFQTLTVGGAISDGGNNYGLTKTGDGGVQLSGSSSYLGATTVNAGTLTISGGDNRLPTGTILTVNGGSTSAGTFDLNGKNQTVAGLNGVSGAVNGLVTNKGTGTSTLTVAASGIDSVYAGRIADSTGKVALTKTGSYRLTLSGSNNYTGATTISDGSLQLGASGTTGSLATSSTIIDNGDLTINRSNAVTQGVDFSGAAITGTGSFTQGGSGVTTLTATNSYTGSTFVNSGTLAIGSTGSIDNSSSIQVASGATYNVANKTNYTVGASQTLINNGTVTGSVRVSGKLNGSGSTGNVVLNGGSINGTLRTGTISGTGLVSPGNSAGILTASSIISNSSSGELSFAFELTTTTPDYTNATASLNDILHITSTSGLSLDAGTNISVYFSSLSAGAKFDGGFFVDGMTAADLEAAIANVTFTFYVKEAGGSTSFNGSDYALVNNSQISVSAVDVSAAAFNTGTVGGAELEFTAIPEPGTWGLLLGGMGMLLGIQRLRRRGIAQ